MSFDFGAFAHRDLQWIGSNETWFSPERGLLPDAARQQARDALREIGWPGGTLRQTEFSTAFAAGREPVFQPNPLQKAVADAAHVPGIVIVEGPMGCGKTEAALFAAQQFIASGQQQGICFALPTQVTSTGFISGSSVFSASLHERGRSAGWQIPDSPTGDNP